MEEGISFIPRSQRVDPEPEAIPSTSQSKMRPIRTISKQKTTQDRTSELIRERYVGRKPTSYRNITAPHLENWSLREDTTRQTDEIELTLDDRFVDDLSIHRKTKSARDPSEIKRRARIWRADHDITLISNERVDVPPLFTWRDMLPDALCQILESNGFNNPLPVQSQCISLALRGHDVIGLSQPGTGKTLAYVLPVIARILKSNLKKDSTAGPLAIVLVPTHELAEQVATVIQRFSEPLGINCMCLIGGFSITDQALALGRGFEIVVATPGRLNDVLESRLMVIERCQTVVLDEADKMVDRSFGPQIEAILSVVPETKRLLMFSATMPNEVLSIVENFFRDVVRVRVGQIGDASETIKQIVHYVPKVEKKELFLECIHGMKPPIIVFVNTKETCEDVANFLGFHGFRAASIHGGKTQKARDAVVNAMIDKATDIIVATEVLARGIDINDIQNVVNYDMPSEIGSYVHRIGRTGRAGASGVATSFVTPDDVHIMHDLTRLLQRNHFAVPQEMLNNPASQERVHFTE